MQVKRLIVQIDKFCQGMPKPLRGKMVGFGVIEFEAIVPIYRALSANLVENVPSFKVASSRPELCVQLKPRFSVDQMDRFTATFRDEYFPAKLFIFARYSNEYILS